MTEITGGAVFAIGHYLFHQNASVNCKDFFLNRLLQLCELTAFFFKITCVKQIFKIKTPNFMLTQTMSTEDVQPIKNVQI